MKTKVTGHEIVSRDGQVSRKSRRFIGKAILSAALFLSTIPMAEAAIIGNIDGVVQSGTDFYINGWACDSGVSASISVHVYVGGPAGAGTGVGQAVANRSTEAAVSSRCQTTGIPHRFSILLPVTVRREHQGEKIYVHGISQSGGSNLTITNSGVFTVPAPVSLTRRYFYDSNERLCAMVEPEIGTQFYQYDAAGNLIRTILSTTTATGCLAGSSSEPTINRTYDQRGRLKTLTFSDGKGDQTWTYTPDSLPASVAVVNPNVTNPTKTTYSYNKRRLLAGEGLSHLGGTSAWGAGYGYNANGDLSALTYPSGFAIDYAPNALGQATKAGAYASAVKYHPNGAIASFTYGNGITHTMTQNDRQLPANSTDSGGVLNDDYGYDPNGNVDHKWDSATGGASGRWMKYDGLDRLIQAFSPAFGGDNYANYTYDGLDNIRTAQVHGNDYTYVYDAKWRLTNVTNTVGGASVIGLGYDVRGNLANKNGQTFIFDYGNRLRSSVSPSSYWYAYDGQGRRVLSCSPSACNYQMYSQAGQLLMTQDNRDSTRTESIYLSGSLVALHELNTATGVVTAKYQHTDALGSPVATTDASGKVIERSDYDPYGKLLNRPLKDGPGYTGHASDAAIGLSYMQQRYYDPQIGRFLSVDPVTTNAGTGGNFNRYKYAANNPYKFTDPDGRQETTSDVLRYADPIQREVESRGLGNLVAYLLCGCDESYKPPPGSGAIQSVVTPFEFAAASSVTRGVGGVLTAGEASASAIANPVPNTLARVIPDGIPATNLGAPSAADVFVTAADDIAGMTSTQIAERLTIPQSPTGFRIFEFPTPQSGLASPVFRTNPGFVGGGRTAGGAREFVIPNQPIPPDTVQRVVAP